MAVSNIIVEVDCLAGVFIHEALVDIWTILWRDKEPRPTDPGEVQRLFEAREGRYKSTRGHLEVVFTRSILGDRYRQPVGDDDEMGSLTDGHVGGIGVRGQVREE